MFGPQTHTHPTELMLTFSAGHMIAAAVLFDSRLTFGAFLRVGRDPVRGFGIIFAFLEPHLD